MSSPASQPAKFGTWMLKALAGQLISLAFLVVGAGIAFRSIFHHFALVLLLLQLPGIIAYPIWYFASKHTNRPKKSAFIFAGGVFTYFAAFLLIVACLLARFEILAAETARVLVLPIFIAAFLGSAAAFYEAFRRLSRKQSETMV